MSTKTNNPHVSNRDDLKDLSPTDLISRITALEDQLKATTAQLSLLSLQPGSKPKVSSSSPPPAPVPQTKSRPKKTPKPFDPSSYATRRIALKFSYIGAEYNGFEHTNNATAAPAKPTIEEVLWKALRKARLISPTIPDGADQSYDVVWGERQRAERYGTGMEGFGRGKRGRERLELVWDDLAYSKCGRTDKGVSAFGQVVGITVRSSRPVKQKRQTKQVDENEGSVLEEDPAPMQTEVAEDEHGSVPDWDPIRDELPYIANLNSLLPPTIRILAWCPNPSETFDARFSCKERRYKYFFTNPAMCPTPGMVGMTKGNGTQSTAREGWLDIESMRKAAKKLEGLHDYRNFCKIDASKQMTSCERRITYADIEEFNGSLEVFSGDPRLNQGGSVINGAAGNLAKSVLGHTSGPKVYAFAVHGTAFLWHQVRCMVAILFLVGQGLEQPEIVDRLLDIENTPGKPHYEMADDAPLVLWDCVFPADDSGADGLKWIYAGDEATLSTLATKGDGSFGIGGVVDQLWVQWRKAKMQETLAAGLLNLALRQGDGTALDRGGQHDTESASRRSQRVFDGSDVPRHVGDYIPVMQKPKMESLEVQNAKYAAGKQARRDAKRANVD